MIARKSLLITTCWALTAVHLAGQPTITVQPTDQFVSLGATAKFKVIAITDSPPLACQWWFKEAAIDAVVNPTATNSSLVLSNVTMAQGGSYWAVLSDTSGSVTSRVAQLIVDPTSFTKITTGPLVTDLGCSWESGSWGDYDGDGYADLFTARYNVGHSALYRNNRDGTFTSITNVPFAKTADAFSGVWADFDNDGRPDLFVAGYGKPSFFYFNNGDGTFSVSQPESTSPFSVSAADYNQDGLLDLFIPRYPAGPGRLYRNNGDRTFTRMTSQEVGPLVSTSTFGGAAWADYDDDGMVEVYAANNGGSRNFIFHNDGTGRFLPVTNLVTQTAPPAIAGAWGDYNNDGKLDLCVGCFGGSSTVYRNLGNGQFEKANIGLTLGMANSVSWVDYDNDGFQDLFFTYPNALYHNNGDGTFRRVTTASVENDTAIAGGASMSGLWFDYDNDGFLDLYVFNGNDAATAHTANFLYHNNGNSNAWLKIKLIGTVSNRDGIGAKVRALATYAGQSRWQRHDISGGDGLNGNNLYAHFGLGDTTNVDLVRIEWPSGNVQELTNVTPNQILPIREIANITPTNPSSSLNGSVTLNSLLSGTYQWYHEGVDLVDQTNKTLKLSNLQTNDAGHYSVIVTTAEQVVTNYVYLRVNTTFTKITTGAPVTDLGTSWGGSWGDYDGDGFADLFVPRNTRGQSALYRNNGDSTFTTITNAPASGTSDAWGSSAWADLDNDGRLDLVVTRYGKPACVYFSNGDGTFATPLQLAAAAPWNVAVADYNRDGLLDVLLNCGSTADGPSVSILYRNNGDRTFTRMTGQEVGPMVSTATFGAATWADYDDDGWVELFCPNSTGKNCIFHNNGAGRFTSVKNLVTSGSACAGAWGDYDNDGRLDLCAARWGGSTYVYRNLGNGEFERADIGPTISGTFQSTSWADYDNDGFLDLLLVGQGNQLYHNNGDGTFTRINTGSIVTETPVGANDWSYSALWFDYDNDGFLDLYISNGNDPRTANTANFLFHNNSNSNSWLKVKLSGTASNRDGVGAKVRVEAKYAGQLRWQRRDISGGDGYNGNHLYAHFGLGDAKNVTTLQIEWPSGIVQELHDVTPNQFLTVTEPSRLQALGIGRLQINSWKGMSYEVQASTNLADWTPLGTVTNLNNTLNCIDPKAVSYSQRFYRALEK